MKNRHLTLNIICIFLLILNLTACNNKKQMNENEVLANTDRLYSTLSAEKGMNTAFLAMFDPAGVLLRKNHPPIEGFDAIRTLLLSENESTFTLTWEPVLAKVAASGEMGYTYGTYKLFDKATDSLMGEGTYATIWQKNSNGEWKAMLDTGNAGLK
jgi:ketosteroid isomerase-like protein